MEKELSIDLEQQDSPEGKLFCASNGAMVTCSWTTRDSAYLFNQHKMLFFNVGEEICGDTCK